MKLLIVVFAAALFVQAAEANLLVNGSFETVDSSLGLVHGIQLDALGTNQWDVYSAIPGWTTTAGKGIEVQYDNTVTPAFSAFRKVELDSHPGPNSNSTMSQDVALAAGLYELSFWYQPRTGTTGDNGILASVESGFGALLVDGIAGSTTDWTQHSFQFNLDADQVVTVSFAATGIENLEGGLIDDVALNAVAAPEPTTLAIWSLLFAIGACGDRWNKRRKQAT